jgi:hypothetical protein
MFIVLEVDRGGGLVDDAVHASLGWARDAADELDAAAADVGEPQRYAVFELTEPM